MFRNQIIRGLFIFIVCVTGAETLRAASGIKVIKLIVTNSQSIARIDKPVVVSVDEIRKIAPDFDGKSFLVTTSDAANLEDDALAIKFRQIAAQMDDLDGDGKTDELAFVMNLAGREKRVVTIAYGAENVIAPLRIKFAPRTHAAFQKKYEGMGWESDRVAWRLYFDARNAIDLFGKRQPALMLDYFAQSGVDYHQESPFGRDIYKNGDALGIGAIGALVNDKPIKVAEVAERTWKVIANGPVRSIVSLNYKGWKVGDKTVDLTSRITIWAGQHWFEHLVTMQNGDGVQLITGLPAKEGVDLVQMPSPPNGRARHYIATWGKQVLKTGATAVESLPDQNLGLAVMLPNVLPANVGGLTDTANHLVKVPLEKKEAASLGRFYVVAGWDQEADDGGSATGNDPSLTIPTAVRSLEAWELYVDTLSIDVQSPARVEIASKSAAIVAAPLDTLGEVKPKTYAEAIELMRGDADRTAEKWSRILTEYGEKTKANFPNDKDLNFDGTPNKWTMRRGRGFFTERDNITGEWREQTGFYWTGNFWVGELWRLYAKTKDEKYARWARLWNDVMLGQEPNEHHDVGFLNFYTSAFAYDASKDAKYKAGALRAAERLKQLYNPRTKLIAAWDVGGEDSIIDTMMNLQIWYWASKETGDPQWRELARQHALKAAEWLIREDGSVIQSVHYDPNTGRHRHGHTHQGFGNETAWARGTGWGLYGFAIAARETKDPKLLETAERIAQFVMKRTPDDHVAWHDYHDEGINFRLKDTSAAALAANGFFQLSELVADKKRAAEYRQLGERIVNAV
ncbi:MAG: glycoside hydrolase family 88 protein, partial [Acidobacteriota bacterium]|nr:glycoside hydrolase family 88 protein [Acidobacteriota bacterium]